MKNIIQYNDKQEYHGYWEVYWILDMLWYKRYYINGIENGYEEFHHTYKDINTVSINFHL